jgi:hypothetical protein
MLDCDDDILIDELTKCQICLNSYDEHTRKPYSIFSCGHTICIVCLDQIESCSECRGDIQQIAPNWQSLRLLSFIKNEKEMLTEIIKPKIKNLVEQHVSISTRLRFLFQKYFKSVIIVLLISISIIYFHFQVLKFCSINHGISVLTIVLTIFKFPHTQYFDSIKRLIEHGFFWFFQIIFIIVYYFIIHFWIVEIYSKCINEIFVSNRFCFIILAIQRLFFGIWFIAITIYLVLEFFTLCFIYFLLLTVFYIQKKNNKMSNLE